MGLAAGQARLLSITSRKADCEFQSMRLSHQKIALSRQLTDLSNEYQNSLDQTKLIYDYYGTGESTMPLTYDILMTPTTLNNYSPIILTDTSGRTVLNSKYASAARSAGIPQEGLGTLPSETMRNAFINGLYSAGIINEKSRDSALMVPYNQGAGNGSTTVAYTVMENGNIDDLIFRLNNTGDAVKTITQSELPSFGPRTDANGDGEKYSVLKLVTNTGHGYSHSSSEITFSLADLLTDSKEVMLGYEGIRGEQSPIFGIPLMQKYIADEGGFIDWLYDQFAGVLNVDEASANALDYALRKTRELIMPDKNLTEQYYTADWHEDTDDKSDYDANDGVRNFLDSCGTRVKENSSDDEEYQEWIVEKSKEYIGFTFIGSGLGGGDDGNDHATGGISLNNVAKAFLTYFADYMNGVSKLDANNYQQFSVGIGKVSGQSVNNLATSDYLFQYTFYKETITNEDAYQAQFWDTLFNQICQNGWTEDSNVDDSEYLQEVLQSGKLFLSRVKDDGYYYQVNYSTDSYIKEVADETLIAQAEAKYNTEKSRLNSKEETLDLKMKNIETEISSLTTEYDTVKNTISKNIEKSFKRYDA